VGEFAALAGARSALVAVVLGVDPVELEELLRGGTHSWSSAIEVVAE
jgi:hypothetical protein